MKNFKFSRFILFLLVVAVGLLAPSCNHSITATRKADVFTDFKGLQPLPIEPRYASAELASAFEGILLTVFENGKYYQLSLCYIRYGRQATNWFDENGGKWIGVTYYNEGHTWTDFYHSFKDEDDIDPPYVATIRTDDLLVCSGGDNVSIPYSDTLYDKPVLTDFEVIGCRQGTCLVSRKVDGKVVKQTMPKERLSKQRIPQTYWGELGKELGEEWRKW